MRNSSFLEIFERHSWEEVRDQIYAFEARDVERALAVRGRRKLADLMALLSPAAAPYLEEMARLSQVLTAQRFGKNIQMYIPMYLSNQCTNVCTYCGFSFGNKLKRLTLSDAQILKELEVIKSYGYQHILLVSGEAQQHVGLEYFSHALDLVRPHFANISMEVQPLEQSEYQHLITKGLYAVLVYQETYHRDNYRAYHLKGKKANFNYRLETPDRLGKAGIHKIGLGALYGLEDWRVESAFIGLHLQYLEQQYWRSKFSISFPRIRPAEGSIEPRYIMDERDLLQTICAFRIFNENVELSLSTRERPEFRDNILGLGITALSAGSKTDPGGYASGENALEQFAVSDERSAVEVAAAIRARGFEVVWKDWEAGFSEVVV